MNELRAIRKRGVDQSSNVDQSHAIQVVDCLGEHVHALLIRPISNEQNGWFGTRDLGPQREMVEVHAIGSDKQFACMLRPRLKALQHVGGWHRDLIGYCVSLKFPSHYERCDLLNSGKTG